MLVTLLSFWFYTWKRSNKNLLSMLDVFHRQNVVRHAHGLHRQSMLWHDPCSLARAMKKNVAFCASQWSLSLVASAQLRASSTTELECAAMFCNFFCAHVDISAFKSMGWCWHHIKSTSKERSMPLMKLVSCLTQEIFFVRKPINFSHEFLIIFNLDLSQDQIVFSFLEWDFFHPETA